VIDIAEEPGEEEFHTKLADMAAMNASAPPLAECFEDSRMYAYTPVSLKASIASVISLQNRLPGRILSKSSKYTKNIQKLHEMV
jgi:hypothetical protein